MTTATIAALIVLSSLTAFSVVQWQRAERNEREVTDERNKVVAAQEQDQERLAESRLLDAQAALRRHDLASAVEAFGAAIDYLPPSDPRASVALAGIVANLASAPRSLSDIGPVWAAALSVDADKVLVRRHTGRVEVFEGTTGRKLPAPDVGLLHNDFQWMNFMERYPIGLSDDGTLASLVFPAEAFRPGTERTRPWVFTLAVWRPGSDKLLWQSSGDDFSVSHGPRGYVLIRARDESTEILRIGQERVDTMRLSGGTVAEGFPSTGESFIVWQTGGPQMRADGGGYAAGELRLALVDVDKIPSGYSGPVPEGATLWTHSIIGFSGQVRWQGYPAKPAFVFRNIDETWYCDSTACKQITRRDHPIVTYAEAPTTGVRPLIDEFAAAIGVNADKAWDDLGIGQAWAQGPGPNTISFLDANGLRVRDLYSGAEEAIRNVGASVVARKWNRSGSEMWVINGDGEFVSLPIRVFQSPDSLEARPRNGEGRERTAFSPRHDRSLTIRSTYGTGKHEITSRSLGAHASERQTWKKTIPGDDITTHARFSTDGRYVIIDESHVTEREARAKVTVLDAESGVESAAFDSNGWLLDGDAWIGEGRRLAAVSRFSGDVRQTFAVCEWSEAGISRCSKPLETLARISRDGKYFIEDRPYTTAVYASSELRENQPPVLEISGTRARQRFDRALLKLLIVSSDSVHLSKADRGTELTAYRNGTLFVASDSNDGGFSVRVGKQVLRYPPYSFESEHGLWGPEVRDLALASDGRRMIVALHHKVDCEVWDVETGTVLAVLPWGEGALSFSDDNETVQLLTETHPIDLLYLGTRNTGWPAWASGSAMSALVRGKGNGRWRTRDDVLRAINEAAERGDTVSKRVSRMVAEALSR